MIEAQAALHDGVTPVPHPVLARLTPPVLRLLGSAGQAMDWPIATLRVVDRRPGQMRIASGESESRLLLIDPAMITALDAAMAPSRTAQRARRAGRALLIAASVPVVALALWFGWPPLADRIALAMPVSWEAPIGATLVEAMRGSDARCVAPEGMAALRRLTDRLAEAGGLTEPTTLHVIDNGQVNAFATPGGHLVILRGLIASAQSADEVAGVIAHELGHVRHRHGMRSAVRAMGAGLLVSVLIGGSDLGTIGVTLLALSYSRAFEAEADETAAGILARTGIGTEGLAAFFTRMARMEGEGGPVAERGVSIWTYLRSHPHSDERAARLLRAPSSAPVTPPLSAAEWAAIRAMCGQTDLPGRS